MILKIYQKEFNEHTEFNIKQFSMMGDNFAVMLTDGSFKFFNNGNILVEIVEDK